MSENTVKTHKCIFGNFKKRKYKFIELTLDEHLVSILNEFLSEHVAPIIGKFRCFLEKVLSKF